MKRKFLSMTLAVLTMGFLGSCSEINERLDNLEQTVGEIENISISSVQQQIDGINGSIYSLTVADEAINGSIYSLTVADEVINGKITELKTTANAQQALIDSLKKTDKILEQQDKELEARIETLEGLASTFTNQIETLIEADKTINTRIDGLKSYVDTELGKTKDWAKETFATLDQYQQTADDLAVLSVTVTGINTTLTEIQTSVSELDITLQGKITTLKTELEGKITTLKTELEGKIASAISTSETSIKTWINQVLEGYYTIAQADAKISALNSAIDAAKGTAKERIDSVATELTALKTAVDTAKTNIRNEYKKAIDTAINKLNGKIQNELMSTILAVNWRATVLSTRVTELESRILAVEGKVDNLLAMIQSVSIVPAYNDGSVEVKDGILNLNIVVEPAEAVIGLTKDGLKVLMNEVKTKAVSIDTVALTAFKVDTVKGIITARADISSKLPVASGKALTMAVNIKNGISKYTTDFHPVFISSESNVTITGTDTTRVTIKADADFPESVMGKIAVATGFKSSKPTVIYVEGIGSVIFDKKAVAKINANAGQAGATDISFMVKDVTTIQPVPNADMVLEITMKTVGETGAEVFCEQNAEGEATIEIPMDEDVYYVDSVFLVNEDGEPIQGGIIPGSENFENGKLTFKVNHFSKYAIDYVTKAEFVPVTGASIEQSSSTLVVGDTLRLTVTITPDNATNKKITWSSSDATKVNVDNTGKITAIAMGNATITATTNDGGKQATCSITVKEIKTLAEILATNSKIPEAEDMTPPSNAWVNGSDSTCKAFIGVDEEGDTLFFVCKKSILVPGSNEIAGLGLCMDNPFEKIDGNTYKYIDKGDTIIVSMTESKFTSMQYRPQSGSQYGYLAGTYAEPILPPDGALKGIFTVNANGKKVYFSRGNLYWDGNSFKFETNQYDYSNWSTSHISHFYWSKTAETTYAKNYSDKATVNDVFFTNATTETAKTDFTVNGVTGKYRTLSTAEWQYLLDTRTVNSGTGEGKSYQRATINSDATSVYGIILYPDNYTSQISATSYTSTEWTAMETAGCVFLPASGRRTSSTIDQTGTNGYYWSSSANNSKATCAYYVYFESQSISSSISGGRGRIPGDADNFYGLSVRLVTDGSK